MKRTANCIFVDSIALVAATVTGCTLTYSEGDDTDSSATAQSSLIHAKDCLAVSPHGRVGICHATGKRARPYVFERVKPNVCARIHARHPGDFISSDPTCPVCGNGIVENGETCDPLSSCPTSCDDGNACTADQLSGSPTTCNATCSHTLFNACAAGDGCCPTGCSSSNDSDCAPTCTPTSPFRKLKFSWLGRSCGATQPEDVVFTLNEHEVARVPLANSCDCAPGVGNIEISDQALLAFGVNGTNTFRVTSAGELSWGTVALETPEFGGEYTIWAAWPFENWNDATSHPADLCTVGVQDGLDLSGLAMNLAGGVSCN